MKLATLTMTDSNDAIIVDLQQDESGIITGAMGACCSVILLWGLSMDTERYLHLRGHHAGGGPEQLNWDRLLQGVDPGQKHGSLVVACSAPGNREFYEPRLQRALQDRGVVWPLEFYEYAEAFINRAGAVTRWNATTPASKEHTIRKTTRTGGSVTTTPKRAKLLF